MALMAICTYGAAARVLLFYCYYLEFYSMAGSGNLMHGKCDMIFYFFLRRLRKVKKYSISGCSIGAERVSRLRVFATQSMRVEF